MVTGSIMPNLVSVGAHRARELPADDGPFADAVAALANGPVYLVRGGETVAELVETGRRLGEPVPAPLEVWRRVYRAAGAPWPGDEEVRRQWPVADADPHRLGDTDPGLTLLRPPGGEVVPTPPSP
jgi:hypothetical protein